MTDATHATPFTTTYLVDGMTCSHCVSSVSGALQALPGVEEVTVNLESGAVTVAATAPLDAALVATAVAEAGYEVRS